MKRVNCSQVVALISLLAGCSGDPSTGGRDDSAGNAGNTSGNAAGTAGAAVAGSGTAGTFDNSTGMIGGAGGVTGTGTGGVIGDDAGECVLGERCGPTDPDGEGCGTLTLEGEVKVTEVPGNVLLVFDRSSSMNQDWNGMQRWQAAGSAMLAALMPLQDKLTMGAVFFPDTTGGLFGPGCLVEPITAADQIAFMPGAMALTKMQAAAPGGMPTPLYAPSASGTPTLEGLQAADAALASATLTGTTTVILVTDGDPNCAWNEATATGIVSAWAAQGIKTYVLGVPGVGGGGVATLNAVAMAGGTMQYIPPTDAATLEMTIRDIVSETISMGIDSCTVTFDPPAGVPDKLTLAIVENGVEAAVPHNYPDGTAAWTITPDGVTAELLGNTCLAAMNGTYTQLRFVFGCEDLPPAEPPPGPE